MYGAKPVPVKVMGDAWPVMPLKLVDIAPVEVGVNAIWNAQVFGPPIGASV